MPKLRKFTVEFSGCIDVEGLDESEAIEQAEFLVGHELILDACNFEVIAELEKCDD